jgi:DNA repair protein RecN (Recombination protein N)
MLLQLFIKNIALIDQIEIPFGKGLHVMTGETGAGKSIVVDAMSLILGGRADRDLIRTGCDKAYAEGLFDLSDCPAAAQWLGDHEIDAQEGTVTLAREVNQNGRSLCRIQGVSMPLAALRELSGLLMDLHGQHEHQSLLDEKNHLSCLDAMGDRVHADLIHAVACAYREYHDAALAYKRLKQESTHREERMRELQAQEQELADAELTDGEEEQLVQERDRFRATEKITQGLHEAYAALYELGAGRSATEQARTAMHALAPVARYGKEYEQLSQRAQSLYYDAEDLSQCIRGELDALEDNPDRARQVEERLDLIRKLSRRYGATVADMLAALERIREELSKYQSMDAELDRLRRHALELAAAYDAQAAALSESRKQLAQNFAHRMEQQLNDLNMRGTRFYVEVAADAKARSALGIDSVRFLIAPNAGEEKKSLAKIASGGELSRVMLALKALSAERAAVPSMVFDEIDTGISGRTAQVVAQKMWDIARYRQVICVTHLQQIAAMATRHYLIQKAESDGRTHTSVTELMGDARVWEIARMLSGVSENSRSGMEHARTMLTEAEAYREKE